MRENLLPSDGEAFLMERAVPKGEADRLFEALLSDVPWRQDQATVMGRRVLIPRLQAWFGESGYIYSGIRLEPLPWTPDLLILKRIAEGIAGSGFNSVLVNLYRHGQDSVSWHADDEPGLGRNPTIASLSLGATRRFQLKHRTTGARVDMELAHGSCLVMAGATQHHWLHQLPKTRRPVGPRINLTFRRMRSEQPGSAAARRTLPRSGPRRSGPR